VPAFRVFKEDLSVPNDTLPTRKPSPLLSIAWVLLLVSAPAFFGRGPRQAQASERA
jgi:hypothetical protein